MKYANLCAAAMVCIVSVCSLAGADVYRLASDGGVIHVSDTVPYVNAVIQEPRGLSNNYWIAASDGDIYNYWPNTGTPFVPADFSMAQSSTGSIWTQLIPNSGTATMWASGKENGGVVQIYDSGGPTEWTIPNGIGGSGTYIALEDNPGLVNNFFAAKQGGGLYNIFGGGSNWYENEILPPSEGEFNVILSWESNVLYAAKSDGSGIWRIGLSGGTSTDFVETSDGHVYTSMVANYDGSTYLSKNFFAAMDDGGIKNFYLASQPLTFQSDDMLTDTAFISLAENIASGNNFFAASADAGVGVVRVAWTGSEWLAGDTIREGLFVLGEYNAADVVIAGDVEPTTCQQMISLGQQLAADLNADCYVEWADFGIFASQWQECNNPADGNCNP